MSTESNAAARALDEAALRRRQVRAAGPDERRIALGWALFVLVFVPPFDILDGAIAGPVVLLAGIAGTVVTRRYAHLRLQRVRPVSRRALGWCAWGAFYGGLILAANLLHDEVSFAFTAAAVIAALPLVGFALVATRRPR